ITCPPRAVTASSAAHRSSCARRMSVAVASGKPSSSTTSPASTTVSGAEGVWGERFPPRRGGGLGGVVPPPRASTAGLLGQVPRQRLAGPPGHVGADRRQVQIAGGDHLPAGRDGHLEQVGDLRSWRGHGIGFLLGGFYRVLSLAPSNDAPGADPLACDATRCSRGAMTMTRPAATRFRSGDRGGTEVRSARRI